MGGIETHGPVTVERTGRVALVRLASANPLNPLSDEVVGAVGETVLAIEADPGIHATVLTGSERAFAAGADVTEMAPLDYAGAFGGDVIGRAWDVLCRRRKPVVAAVRGFALGGGCELAMLCDVVVAGEDATFGQPEIVLGIVPGAGGTQRLPRAVGKSLAMQMCLTGDPITADQALAAGLVSAVVPAPEVVPTALTLAERIARHSLPVILAVKEAVDRSFESSLSEGLLFERRAFHAGFALTDQKEGIAAFRERRRPDFTNR
ncbi:enoyl-CoA hydratase-related protein [Pseudonocardia lutea]|uniref:Enoyl-CoA hydratase-related protein n=1 Tax=Pseudonocardia lutea TaxID=2172015 RepID=A0ABW1I3W7_9PSEU